MLSAPAGAVYLRQGDPPLYHLTEAIGPAPPLHELSSGCPLVEALRSHGTLAQPVAACPLKNGSARCHSRGAAVALPPGDGGPGAAATRDSCSGCSCLAPAPTAPTQPTTCNCWPPSRRLTVLALVSAEGHRTIEALNRDLKAKVEKIAEQQRRILALQSQLKREDRKPPVEEAPPSASAKEKGGRMEEQKPASPEAPASLPPSEEGLIGSSPQVQNLLHLVKRVAASASSVLLRGESGTGKGVLARAIHESSPRAGKPFVKVHCAALSAGLLESELFGHVKGAFTNAFRDKVGRFETAHGGTLFFDEIGDISLEVQTKLLRVLEEMTFERVGSSEPMQVDVRIIAATHRDLEGMIAEGRFRQDLFFRLNVLPILVPPLRDRAEDVAELVLHFLRLYALRAGKQVTTLDDDALAVLKAFSWPGNIRQLENVIERAVIVAEGPTITAAELPDEVKNEFAAQAGEAAQGNHWPDEETNGLSLPELASVMQTERIDRERREREQLVRALAAAGGNKAVAARALGVARSTLVSRLKKFGLS